jgi:predicted nuclease of predicted toxin-antitoxin system
MRFLVDANMPRSAAVRLQQMGHDAVDVRDIGLGGATDDVIAAHARHDKRALVTRDFDFADIRNYPPADYAGIVVL